MARLIGYLNLEQIECTYNLDGNKLFIIPNNPEKFVNIRKIIDKENMIIESNPGALGKNVFFVKNGSLASLEYISFEVIYYFSLLNGYKINGLVFTSEALDKFVKPASLYYYYRYTLKQEITEEDLLYKRDVIQKFSFKIDNKIINATIFTGQILEKGIASDLKLHAKLQISFEETEKYEFLYYVYCLIKKFLQLTLYCKNIKIDNIDLLAHTGHYHQSYIGRFYPDLSSCEGAIPSQSWGTEFLLISKYLYKLN